MSKKSASDKLAIGRHTGDSIWGYEVFADGRIKLSPGFADRFRSILDRESGLSAMQEGVSRFVSAEFTRTNKERREWWQDLSEDTGLDITKKYTFNSLDGCICLPEEEKELLPQSPQETSHDH